MNLGAVSCATYRKQSNYTFDFGEKRIDQSYKWGQTTQDFLHYICLYNLAHDDTLECVKMKMTGDDFRGGITGRINDPIVMVFISFYLMALILASILAIYYCIHSKISAYAYIQRRHDHMRLFLAYAYFLSGNLQPECYSIYSLVTKSWH